MLIKSTRTLNIVVPIMNPALNILLVIQTFGMSVEGIIALRVTIIPGFV